MIKKEKGEGVLKVRKRVVLAVLTATMLVSTVSVSAVTEESLYERFGKVYGINIVGTDTSALSDRLDLLYNAYTSGIQLNAEASSKENIENVIDEMNAEINDKTSKELEELTIKKENISQKIEDNLVLGEIEDLQSLLAEYKGYEEQIKDVLEERNSLYKLEGSMKIDKVDLDPIEQEIMKYESAIDVASKAKVDLGDLSELKRPFNYELDITDRAGWRLHPIWGDYRFHSGVDYAMPTGTELYSLFNGTVLSAGWYGGYGNCVRIDCGDGIVLLYGHMDSISDNIREGYHVSQNELIGYSGSTGDSTGPHLHLGMYYQEEILDVEDLFEYGK